MLRVCVIPHTVFKNLPLSIILYFIWTVFLSIIIIIIIIIMTIIITIIIIFIIFKHLMLYIISSFELLFSGQLLLLLFD